MFIHYNSVSELVRNREKYIGAVCYEYMKDYDLPYDLALKNAESDYKIKLETMSGLTKVKQVEPKKSNDKWHSNSFAQSIKRAKQIKDRKRAERDLTKKTAMSFVDCDGRVFESASAFCSFYKIRLSQFMFLKDQRGFTVSRISELVNEGKIQHVD